ncbi:DUF6527 family protein [Pseudorhodoplanes sp.]|uniref:DUF6527 family protein n=1 Tax=Pseudorhodoplanes sp. TaxID=1934341 RepID=UPI003D0A59E8
MIKAIQRSISNAWRWAYRKWDSIGSDRRIQVIAGDTLPPKLPRRDLVLARDGDEDWCVGMQCPCGCGMNIELLVIAEAKPRWDVVIDSNQRPTLRPSVWVQRGCRSHFWLRDGRVFWCD